MPAPTLTTQRLTLRAFRPSDWDGYAAMMADVEVVRFIGGKTLTREECWDRMAYWLGAWELRGYGMFAVDYQGWFVGRVGIIHPLDWPEPELGWTVSAPFWGKGMATEAAQCVREWAFRTFAWNRLVSFIDPANTRSIRVAEKLGAAQGEKITLRGTVVDQWIHPAPGRGVIV